MDDGAELLEGRFQICSGEGVSTAGEDRTIRGEGERVSGRGVNEGGESEVLHVVCSFC